MRFNCPDRLTKYKAQIAAQQAWVEKVSKWHSWFAWYPVRIEGNQCVWLEWIMRRYPTAWASERVISALDRGEPEYRLTSRF